MFSIYSKRFLAAIAASTFMMQAANLAEARDYQCIFEKRGPPAGVMRNQMQYTAHRSNDGAVLILEGSINDGESQRLEQALREVMGRAPISEVWLNSGGGNAVEGMKMGRVLRRYGVATRIPNGFMCFSACSYAFLGGPFRAVEEGADYGVHMFTASPHHTGQVLKELQKDIQTKNKDLKNMEHQVKGIEQGSAQFAAMFMEYLSEMGISTQVGLHNFETANEGGSCPPPAVLRQWNVVNSD
jgi:hypothetical protein